jgi:metallo-beta-lactamase family protein
LKELRRRNWDPLPVDPSTIDAVILTHAHIDHSGYIPLLVKHGFKGKVLCSEATYALCEILLPDSGYLQEEDAKRANRYGYTKHQPAEPLYTEEDAEEALKCFKAVDFGTPYALSDSGECTFTLSRSGHILGSAFITLSDGCRQIIFSGDMGRMDDAVMKTPAKLNFTDYLVIESTYGNRKHKETNPKDELEEVINSTAARGGSVLIPAFAVGRTQSVLYYVYQLKQEGKIPMGMPVYLDSPMAISATNLMRKYHNEHRLSEELAAKVCDSAKYVRTVDESKLLDASGYMPSIIISASGMATGGRVLHHLKAYVTDPKHTILFTGFQAAGTRGDRMVRGEKEIKIHGSMYPVRARVENLDNVSAHADYEEILAWLSQFSKPPKKVFVTHGESKAAFALKEKIETQLGWNNVVVPEYLDSEDLR